MGIRVRGRASAAPRPRLSWGGPALVAAWSLACGALQDPAERIVFVEPVRYVVKAGDDIPRVARLHKVDVVEIIEWNGLTQDISPGQTLLVWPHRAPDAPTAVAAAPDPGAPPGTPPRPRGAPPAGSAAPRPGAPPPAPPTYASAEPPTPPIGTVRGAGLLGADLGDSEVDLAAAASGMQRYESSTGASTFGGRTSLGSGGTVDTIEVEQRKLQPVGPQIPNTPVTPPRLTKPAAKRCLSAEATVVDENGSARESGLTVGQINAGMAQINRHTPKCFPSGTVGTYSLTVEITVACSGQVSNVFTVSPGAVPPNVTGCLEQVLGYAGFPAHGVPDGMAFQYPMKFTF